MDDLSRTFMLDYIVEDLGTGFSIADHDVSDVTVLLNPGSRDVLGWSGWRGHFVFLTTMRN